MSWIDEDFKKLKYYAKSLGLVIKYENSPKADYSAYYASDHKAIYLNMSELSKKSKTRQLLILLHEISHHREFLASNKKDTELLYDALHSKKPNKAQRAAIYVSESNAALYMPIIAEELNLKVPFYKVKAEADLDKWIAETYYQTSKYPKRKNCLEKRRELLTHYKEFYKNG